MDNTTDNELDENKRKKIIILALIILIALVLGTTYAFYNYTRTGPENKISTGVITFNFQDSGPLSISNQFPISESDLTDDYKIDRSLPPDIE